MKKSTEVAIYGNIFAGLFVALILSLLYLFNSLPITKDLSNYWLYSIDSIILISLIIIFLKTHKL